MKGFFVVDIGAAEEQEQGGHVLGGSVFGDFVFGGSVSVVFEIFTGIVEVTISPFSVDFVVLVRQSVVTQVIEFTGVVHCLSEICFHDYGIIMNKKWNYCEIASTLMVNIRDHKKCCKISKVYGRF